MSTRVAFARRMLTSEATVLLRDGQMIAAAMGRERITEHSVRQAVRSAVIGGLELVAAVVLETNGTLSVIAMAQAGSRSALAGTDPSDSPR